MTPAQVALVAWARAKEIYDMSRDTERSTRATLLQHLYASEDIPVGTKKHVLFPSAEFVVTREQETTLSIMADALAQFPISLLRSLAIKITLNQTFLKSLTAADAARIRPYLTTKPKAASVELRIKSEARHE